MVGWGIPALSLSLLMQGSVGEGPGKRVRGLSGGRLSLRRRLKPSILLHRWEWNPGILLSME